MNDLVLIYINELGRDWEGKFVYEYLFSDSIEDVDGENWDLYPASGQPEPPESDKVIRVGTLKSDMKLEMVQNSDTFAVWDAVDGVIALAWEDLREYTEYPDKRISFSFGETITSVEDKLYERDLRLMYKENGQVEIEE